MPIHIYVDVTYISMHVYACVYTQNSSHKMLEIVCSGTTADADVIILFSIKQLNQANYVHLR